LLNTVDIFAFYEVDLIVLFDRKTNMVGAVVFGAGLE